MDRQDTWCIEPYRQIHWDSNGYKGPCCLFIRSNGDYDPVATKRLMNAGRPVRGCKQCYAQEQRGSNSMRLQSNIEHSAAEDIEELFITLGTACNMACVFCNPSRSSGVAQDMRRGSDNAHINNFFQQQLSYEPRNQSWYKSNEFWNELQLLVKQHPIKKIHFSGGEPFLNNRLYSFLNRLHKDLQIVITTNGSWNENILHVLSEFRQPHLDISIDGVGDYYAIQRYPYTWDWFQGQFEMLKEYGANNDINWTMSLVPNALNIMNIVQWCEFAGPRSNVNFLNDMPHMGVWNLPDSAKSRARELMDHPAVLDCFDQADWEGIVNEFDEPQKFPEKLHQLVEHWNITRNQDIWNTVGWHPNEENTNNR